MSDLENHNRQGFGNRYVAKHHLAGMFLGALFGCVFGAVVGGENSVAIGGFVGLIAGEIFGIFYSQFL